MQTHAAAALTVVPHGHQASGHVNSPSFIGLLAMFLAPSRSAGVVGLVPTRPAQSAPASFSHLLCSCKELQLSGRTSPSLLAAAPAEPLPQPR